MDVDESAGKGATRKRLPVPGLERTSLNSVLRDGTTTTSLDRRSPAWTRRERTSPYADPMNLKPGQLWSDENGHARICGVVPVEGVEYAVLLRTRGAGGRKRRPFLFPVSSILAGDDGWCLAEDPDARAPAVPGKRPRLEHLSPG